MIGITFFILAIGGFAALVAYCQQFLHDQVITCNCGKRHTYRHVIVDPIDLDRIAQTLTEACPTCQANRRGRDRWDRRYEHSERRPSGSGQSEARSPQSEARYLTHAKH